MVWLGRLSISNLKLEKVTPFCRNLRPWTLHIHTSLITRSSSSHHCNSLSRKGMLTLPSWHAQGCRSSVDPSTLTLTPVCVEYYAKLAEFLVVERKCEGKWIVSVKSDFWPSEFCAHLTWSLSHCGSRRILRLFFGPIYQLPLHNSTSGQLGCITRYINWAS